ncbi:HlyD family secretion protein [Herbaspirillum frisingense]|uniref:HlyD family secretion protein n=1 Tax=Herbaspirillum frisingense TaxID=92645 RepID=UPI001604540A|nr:HlyD family secretion protein [Herbaspirillum frisingense]QNB06133.1 HlyD family secretion protein [Herbaspirillum frisingense]
MIASVTPTWRPPKRALAFNLLIVALAILALLAIASAWGWLPLQRGEVTENAYVRGRTTVFSPQVSGYVTEVLKQDFQRVQANEVLVRIDDRTYVARVEQARANLQAARANLANNIQAKASSEAALHSQMAALLNAQAQLVRSTADLGRASKLVTDGSVSKREYDQAIAAQAQSQALLRQASAAREQAEQAIVTVKTARGGLEAAVASAQAQLEAARIDLEHTVIRAPEAGQLGEVNVRRGQYVTNGTQLMALVPDERWIIANYKEAQTQHMRIGQTVSFSVDALGGAVLHGHLEQIAPAAASEFAVLKPDNASGNFVKIPQRIGVRISVDDAQQWADRLRPGMSVVTRIQTVPAS